jgi:hypothetical protein
MKRIMQSWLFWLFLAVMFALPVLPQPCICRSTG